MKKFKQLVKELPSKKVVFAFGRFQPISTGHALLINAVKTIASKQNADHVIIASKTQDKKQNPLPVDRKIYYMERAFPNINFMAANDAVRTPIEAAKFLNQKYKNLIMIAGSDRVPAFTKLLNEYNGKEYHFDTIEVISAGERDPDSDTASGMSGTKMRDAAKKGDFISFKKGLPHTLTELDAKRLMNEIRKGLGLEAIKEQVVFERDIIREDYHAGKIFNVGDIVESNDVVYQIKKRGANHLLLQDQSGRLVNKWLNEVTVSNKNYILQEGLYEMKFSSADKIKVARIIASALGLEDTEKTSSPEQLINAALRKVRSKQMRPEYIEVLNKMLQTADEAGIEYDKKLVPQKAKIEEQAPGDHGYDVSHHLHQIAKAKLMGKDTTSAKAKLRAARAGYDEKENESDIAADAYGVKQTEPHRQVGHSLTHPDVDSASARTMKINYMEEVELDEDQATAEYTVKKWIGQDGKTHQRKVRPHRVTFKASKANAEPEMKDVGDVKESLQSTTADIPPEGEDKVAGLTATVEPKSKRGPKPSFYREEKEDDAEEHEEILDNLSDRDLEDLANEIDTEEEVLDAYDDEELALVDADTGEHVDDLKEEVINEVLSRMERIKAKARFARTQAKRERRIQIALKTRSSSTKINQRARKLAINLLKQRLARKPLANLTVSEKERIEKVVQKRKAVINRLAMKLVGRVRNIENARLTHRTFTK